MEFEIPKTFVDINNGMGTRMQPKNKIHILRQRICDRTFLKNFWNFTLAAVSGQY